MDNSQSVPSADELAVLDQVVSEVARLRHLSREDAQDFAQSVQVRLVERDYDIFRRFTGRSSLKTYLRTVVNRLLLDWRNSEFGKWRASMAAQRLGEHAVTLERLIERDDYSADQAIEILRGDPKAPPPAVLLRLVAQLPPRTPRRRVGHDALERQVVPFDDPVETLEHRTAACRLRRALGIAIGRLSSDDRRLIHLRYHSGCSVQAIAGLLHVDAKTLYRRLERVRRRLYRMMMRSGRERQLVS